MSARILTALAALAFAFVLIAAGPARAEPNTGGSGPGPTKACGIRFEGPGAGQSLEYPDGSSLSVNGTDGKKHTYTCNDGKWTETVSIVAQPPRWSGIAVVQTGVLTLR